MAQMSVPLLVELAEDCNWLKGNPMIHSYPVTCLHMLASYVKHVETISLQETMQGLIFLQNNLIEGNEFTRFGCVGNLSKKFQR